MKKHTRPSLRPSLALACFLCLGLIPITWGQSTWIRCGEVLDVAEGELIGAHTIAVANGRIESVWTGYPAPEAGQSINEIDLKDMTCLPGLMDMHTHLSSEYSPRSQVNRFTMNEADVALLGAKHARVTLAAGFTTVRDLGDSFNATVALREAINQGQVPGPRIYTAAKSIATTGGHADPTNSWRADIMGRPGPRDGVINGVAGAREAVRQRYKDGADAIKITATGGVLSVARSGQNPQFTDDELDAIIAIANDYGMHVAAHAHGGEGMRRAVKAGVHSIEHGTYMDEEIMALMVEKGTWYVPTILAGDFVAEKAQIDGYFPPMVAAKAAAIGPLIQETFGRAYRAGVKIAFGTDCGVSPHGTNAQEFALMVEAGMPADEAIRSATVSAAQLLGVEQELGQIKPGFIADVIAVEGNPLADVTRLESVSFVMRDGEVFHAPHNR
ncbi:MAG TPA: amidohydrolase family protein [Wenzhouxiangella sp.]